jgi:hypothetical protein
MTRFGSYSSVYGVVVVLIVCSSIVFPSNHVDASSSSSFLLGQNRNRNDIIERSIVHDGLTRWLLEYRPTSFSNSTVEEDRALGNCVTRGYPKYACGFEQQEQRDESMDKFK